MKQYLEYYKVYLESLYSSPHTRKQYWIDANQFIKFIENINGSIERNVRSNIKNYRKELENTYQSNASINRKLSSLKVFFAFLKDRNIISSIHEDILQPMTMEKTELKTLTHSEMNKLVNTVFNLYETSNEQPFQWIALRNFCIVLVIANLGLKPSEVVRMKWSHFEDDEVNIIQSKGYRKINVSNSLLQWLQHYKEATLEHHHIDNDFMWLGIGNKKNEPITVKTIERIFQSLSKEVGFYVTATMLRYYVINNESASSQEEQINELYKQFGYVRKSVLNDRIRRFTH